MDEELINFDIVTFLEEYEKFPCLWNKSHIDFKCKIARNNAEQHLMQVTGVNNVVTLRKKIRSVRGTYNNEIRKIKASKLTMGEGNDEYMPKLIWFKIADKFLRPSGELLNVNSVNVDIYNEHVTEPSQSFNIKQDIKPKKKVNTEVNNERITSPVQNKPIRDEDSIYGDLIANKLSHMDKRTKSIVQYHINNIIFQAEMGILDVTSINTNATFHIAPNISEFSVNSNNKLDV